MATERISFSSREEWLAGRDAQGFGGSDAPAIAGCGFITTLDLWRQKTGRTKAKDISGLEIVAEGHRMEPFIREFWKGMHPKFTVESQPYDILFQTERPWLFATPDGEVIDNAGERGGLEIKNVTPRKREDWEEWRGRIPQKYFVQCLHQLLATGWAYVWLVPALHNEIDGSVTIREYLIRWSDFEADIASYLFMATTFRRYVTENIMPPLSF